MKYSILIFIISLFPAVSLANFPLGMNLPVINYSSEPLLFNDAMKTANFRGSDWKETTFDQFPKDNDGYPTQVPYLINGVAYSYFVLFNSLYSGEYALLYDGEGSVSINGVSSSVVNGVRRFTMPGIKTNIWVAVSSVTQGNHVRNIRIIPVAYLDDEASMPTFNPQYISGLRPFHSLRFMDLNRINGSPQREWNDRPLPTSAMQSSARGVAWEYVVQLSNELAADPWICLPHMASDDYVIQLATMLKNSLGGDRKLYLEFSNEMWNFVFSQARYVLENAPGHPNRYVTEELAALGTTDNVTASGSTFSGSTLSNGNKVMLSATGAMPAPLQSYTQYFIVNANGAAFQVATTEGGTAITLNGTGSGVRVHKSDNHPEKDAYMMARAFRLFNSVWGAGNDRLVRVATGQAAWAGNSRRILEYLFETDGIGADALAVGGYFYFDPNDHATWNAMDPATVTPEMILQSAANYYPTHEQIWARQSAAYANQYGVDYLVYEGGQHMQPYNQGDWAYNQAVWDAQIHPGMYDRYMANFATHAEPEVNCKLFVAYSYAGQRESNWGSWGHLESLSQLDSPETLMSTAPKYKALLDWVRLKTMRMDGAGSAHLSGAGRITLQ